MYAASNSLWERWTLWVDVEHQVKSIDPSSPAALARLSVLWVERGPIAALIRCNPR